MKLKIDDEFKELIPPLQEDELKQLKNNLINEGWRDNERIITWNGIIIDGHNRYSICQDNKINFKFIEKKFKDRNEVILWIIDNQLGRRNLVPYDRVKLNLKKEAILKPIAKEKQINPFKAKGNKWNSIGNEGVVPMLAQGKVRETIAKLSKVSHGTVDKVKFIEQKADEETKKNLSKGDETINKVYMDLKRREQRTEAIVNANKPELQTNKKYSIIYADPPWKYFESGLHNQSWHYKTMSIEEIEALPIKELTKEDCILFLWVTFPILEKAFEVIRAWGFKYSTCGFNWVKKNKSGEGWFFGLGNWTRANSELCLIATKGHPIRQSNSVFQIIDEPLTIHSEKPSVVRDKIVELMGDIPRIELFARQKAEGWDCWGNQLI